MYVVYFSLNPEIDIGQIEGAYIMGLGGYLLEKVIYDPETGRVINNGTWASCIYFHWLKQMSLTME